MLLSGSSPDELDEQSATGFVCLVIRTDAALLQKGLELSEGSHEKAKSPAEV